MCEKCRGIYGALLADRLLQQEPRRIPVDTRDAEDNEHTTKHLGQLALMALGPNFDGETDREGIANLLRRMPPENLYVLGQAAASMRDLLDFTYDMMADCLRARAEVTGDMTHILLLAKLLGQGGPTAQMIEEGETDHADQKEREQHEHAGILKFRPPRGPVS